MASDWYLANLDANGVGAKVQRCAGGTETEEGFTAVDNKMRRLWLLKTPPLPVL